jgi:acyl-CoA thioesterase-2
MKISSAQFLDLDHPIDTNRWRLPIIEKTTGGRGSLFGGVGLAAGVVALEQATNKPIVWATGQYLGITQQPSSLDLEVSLPAVGRNVTQGRVVGHLTGADSAKEIITILGACGQRASNAKGLWLKKPEVAPPEDCPLLEREQDGISIHNHVDVRIARGMFGFSGTGDPSGDGGNVLWIRMPRVHHDRGALAIIADYMPSALGNALGQIAYCTSIDNTIRYAHVTDSEWVLCENHMDYVGEGFGYGSVNMWSQDGSLLATASQTVIFRLPTD